MSETPSIFMIHGMWSTGDCWNRLRAHFEERGHRVATPTLPFHDVPPDADPPAGLGTASLRDYTDALEEEIRDFDRNAVIIGHSMGGLLAQKLAARGYGSKLACLAPAPSAGMFPFLPGPTRAFLRTMFKPGFWKKPHKASWAEARWSVFNGGVPEEEARDEYAKYVHESGRALFELAMWYVDSKRAAAVDRTAIDMPVLILVGEADRITPPAWARAAARGFAGRAAYDELPDYGHWLIGEPAWRDVARRLERFIEKGR